MVGRITFAVTQLGHSYSIEVSAGIDQCLARARADGISAEVRASADRETAQDSNYHFGTNLRYAHAYKQPSYLIPSPV